MSIKVRVTCFWETDEHFLNTLKVYGGGALRWKNLEFVSGEKYDRLIILTRPHKDVMEYDPQKAITLLTEPTTSINQHDHPCSRTEAMYLPLPFCPPGIFGISGNSADSKAHQKTALLSCITSDLNYMEGHFHRLSIVHLLDQLIESGLDIWGKSHGSIFFEKLTNYRGELVQKYDGLWKHRYHFNSENSFESGYFTEKIADPIITETLCFYDGCTNLESFIDERAFVRANVKDPPAAVQIILKSIQDNIYGKRIKYIKRQKVRLLTTLNPLNIMWMSVNEKDVLKECLL